MSALKQVLKEYGEMDYYDKRKDDLCTQAASELAALQAENQRLREALEYAAWYEDGYDEECVTRCVGCDMPKADAAVKGHYNNCQLAAALSGEVARSG